MHDERLASSPIFSESAKYLYMLLPYLVGNGVDIGSGGRPIVPWAISIELPADKFKHYNQRTDVPCGIEWLGDIFNLPFKDGVLDWIFSSHLIEDFSRETIWPRLFTEWARCLRPGGTMVILVPDKERWAAAIEAGQTPNCSHFRPEPSVGDIGRVGSTCGLDVIEERLTNIDSRDYSILGVLRKPL